MKNRVAIVTGAAGKGIGRSTALTLGRDGARVVVNYRNSDKEAARVAEQIILRGGTAITCKADVTVADDCARLVEQTIEQFGTVDILVIGPGAGWHPAALGQLSGSDALLDSHAELAPICHLIEQVVPIMKSKSFGRIVGIGVNLSKPSPAFSYNAAKGARAAYFDQAWQSLWTFGITINLVSPGPFNEIASLEEAVALTDHAASWNRRSTATPQDVAEIISFLASDRAAFLTGSNIPLMFN